MKTHKKKKQQKKASLKNKTLVLGGLVSLGTVLAIIFTVKFIQSPSHLISKARAQDETSAKVASLSAQIESPLPKPKPTITPSASPANALPENFGKSVRVPILMYHYIGNNPNPADKARDTLSTTPDKFDEQLSYLASNGYNPISLDTLYAALKGGQLPAKPIVLTFDDGYIDFYVNAFQILKKYSFHATSFIPTGLIGTGYYMSWNQVKELQSSGLISFEAHSITHPSLPSLSPSDAKNQIFESKKVLESEIGAPVNFFAYPYGTSNSYDWQTVKQAGFFGAVGTWDGTVESEGTQYDWPRVRITGGLPLKDFASKL